MEHAGIEVRATWPDQRAEVGIDGDSGELCWVAQHAKHRTAQDGRQVNAAGRPSANVTRTVCGPSTTTCVMRWMWVGMGLLEQRRDRTR